MSNPARRFVASRRYSEHAPKFEFSSEHDLHCAVGYRLCLYFNRLTSRDNFGRSPLAQEIHFPWKFREKPANWFWRAFALNVVFKRLLFNDPVRWRRLGRYEVEEATSRLAGGRLSSWRLAPNFEQLRDGHSYDGDSLNSFESLHHCGVITINLCGLRKAPVENYKITIQSHMNMKWIKMNENNDSTL